MTQYTHAILREPGKSFVNAITQESGRIKPDYAKAIAEHREYADTLKKMGVSTTICPADENFPDGNFVEDTYFILQDKLIIELNPGTASRRDEYTTLKSYLPKHLPMYVLDKRYTIDGGDILQDGEIIYIGLSKRTQQAAIDAFEKIASPFGYKVVALPVPEGLHLKSGMTCVTHKHFIIQPMFESIVKALQQGDNEINYFVVPAEENHAANVLPINGKIMIPAGCLRAKAYIAQFYSLENIFEVNTDQVQLVDGALTCGCLLI